MTSTAHDFGYPLEAYKDLMKKLSILYKKLKFNNISKNCETIINDFNINNETELAKVSPFDVSKNKKILIDVHDFILRCLRDSIDGKDIKELVDVLKKKSVHGYVSAVILCNSYIEYLSKIRYYGLKAEQWRLKNLRMAAAAVVIHPAKEKKIVNRISFEKNPLAYILFLVDNLQEWHRTLRPHHKFPSYNLRSFRFEKVTSTIYLDYILTHENWNDSMLAETKLALEDKRDILSWLNPPTSKFEINISAEFTSSNGHIFSPINVEL